MVNFVSLESTGMHNNQSILPIRAERDLSCRLLCLVLLILTAILSGCAGMYFKSAGRPPSHPLRYTIAELPYSEYWTGIVFNGAKIGFTHLLISPCEDTANCFDIRSEASLRFHFIGMDKRIILKSHDQVAGDLSLKSFSYHYNLDGNNLELTGKLAHGILDVDIMTRGQASKQTFPVKDRLYPTSAICLYPVVYGLALGSRYAYQVYDGETQSFGTVTQEVIAYEQSDLFQGKAFKIKTGLHGQEVITWIGIHGRPLLEMSQGGLLISYLETETMAKRYLTQAALNKNDSLLDFSLVKTNIPIPNPGQVTFMEVALFGITRDLNIPVNGRQRCKRQGDTILCQIGNQMPVEINKVQEGTHARAEHYLSPSLTIPSQNPLIRETAMKITQEAASTIECLRMVVDWIQENIQREPVDVFTALDVLSGKKAECQGHVYLYAALARALNIPTRVVNGIVYSGDYQGFLYHAWAESLVNGTWITVDPTFGQVPADATHIKIVEGEHLSDLLPLVDLIGKLRVQILSVKTVSENSPLSR